MPRVQVLVQLDDAQVARLDTVAEAGEDSRSEHIRRAIDLYLAATQEAIEDVRYADAYARFADDDAELEAFRSLAATAWPKD